MTTTETTTTAVAADPEIRALVTQFLATEARLLDEGREEDWYELLDDAFVYEVPVRQATEPRSHEFAQRGIRVKDTKAHIRTRIDRLNTGIAYSEVPPSRTLRVVGSIEILGTDAPDVVAVNSALLLYRQRGIDTWNDLIPVRREDTIRLAADGPRLLSRRALTTETTLGTPNLAVFL
ncbi:aromatic-ring-hydroxylating dioxygenase subunit beta [Georgenia yuyongxinii]|uniref:Phenylpropionate dioxygenase n=1 Tax=Georgenia yuyongxinii TaxID=2589797 RepID=A0A552WXS1_9MICO|nr:aromatic-ring-hydroxylating dioxygenase subunit beta [Georgenia yuyongxinii]TRW47466.1 phenylpropionate dioxygenase [Georgenia yuyongxinii]